MQEQHDRRGVRTTFVDGVNNCKIVWVDEGGFVAQFVAPQDGGGYDGVDPQESEEAI